MRNAWSAFFVISSGVVMTGEGEVGRDDIIRELVKGSVLEREK